jgi:ABC-type glycerol-3-phosphate transport system substrate-binding protein
MKSLSKVFALICIAVMLLAACGPASTEAPATQPPAQEPTMAATEAPTEAATEAPATETTATEAATQAASGSCPLSVEDGATITFSGWGDETEQKVYRDSIDRFTALCPGVTVINSRTR